MICTKYPATAGVSDWQVRGGMRVREVRYRADAVQSTHCHAEGGLSLVVAGELEETTSALRHRAKAGSLVVKPPRCWHANRYGPRGTRIIQVLTTDGRAPWDDDDCEYHWSESPRLARYLLALLMDQPGAAEAAEMELWDVLDAMQPLCWKYRRASRPRWWPDAVDLLNQCTQRSVSVAAVAKRVGVHPVYSRAFAAVNSAAPSSSTCGSGACWQRGARGMATKSRWRRSPSPLALRIRLI